MQLMWVVKNCLIPPWHPSLKIPYAGDVYIAEPFSHGDAFTVEGSG